MESKIPKFNQTKVNKTLKATDQKRQYYLPSEADKKFESEDELVFNYRKYEISREISKSTVSLPHTNAINYKTLSISKCAEPVKSKKKTLNDLKGKFSNSSKFTFQNDKNQSSQYVYLPSFFFSLTTKSIEYYYEIVFVIDIFFR
jgi:hypothetical protein